MLHALLPVLAAAWLQPAPAQDAPVVRIVVPAPPGGYFDATARMLAQRLTLLTGEPHVVDNRPGGNSRIGVELVVRAPADGRVALLAGTGVMSMALLQKLNFSPMDDLAPVIQVSREHYALVTAAGGPATIGALQALAATQPGGVNCATPPGVAALACEQLKARLGGRLTVVLYQGVAPALQAVMAGHADLMFAGTASAGKLVETDRLRVLAVSGRGGPSRAMSQAPLLSQWWPGFLADGLLGVMVPARTPPSRIRQLNEQIAQVLADPEVSSAMREGGQEPVGGTPEAYARELQRLHQRYADLIRSLDLGVR